ncbi:MAG: hypothetical protein WC025_01490 [Candidatus Magasanikbacteria bacterium]
MKIFFSFSQRLILFLFLFFVFSFTFDIKSVLAETSSTKSSAIDQLHAGAEGAGIAIDSTDPRIIATKVIKIFLSLLGSMAIFLFVYAGYLLITSNGDSAKLGKAGKIMAGAIIGLLLILLSYSITNFVGTRLQQNINQTPK